MADLKTATPVTLTNEQNAIAITIANNVLAIERYGLEAEADLKDGLSGGEIIQLILEAPLMAAAVKSTIETGRKWRKQPEDAKVEMYAVIASVVGGDAVNAKSRVALSFDFASAMAATVSKAVKATKTFVAAIKAIGKSA